MRGNNIFYWKTPFSMKPTLFLDVTYPVSRCFSYTCG